ncbi:MAG: hypothetical protein AAFW98_04800, partial [Pseudomonadota bacterium]
MPVTRRALIAAGAATSLSAIAPWPALAQGEVELHGTLRTLIGRDPRAVVAALDTLVATGDPTHAPSLITALRFSRAPDIYFATALRELTGETRTTWFDWMLWQEANPDIAPHPTYYDFKRDLYLQIDPNFEIFLRPRYYTPESSKIRIEEISWGGVRKDG